MVLAEHHRWAEQHAGRLPKRQKPYQNDADPDRRLRIGYVSPDFYRHSVAYFIEPLLAAHCQCEFEVYCYANVAKPDDYTARLRELAAHWRDINGMDDEEVANLVRQDRIDILVDLTGHFARNRLVVFARKPAPIQVSYLGYRNTTGLDAIDYRLTDGLADPKDQDQFYSEKLIRLPRCFLCYKPPANAPPVQPSDAPEKASIT
ncbi:MAG: hypothetical protein IIB73_12945, partial [Proteobacteria bacterium]|nr:hypothetical protein [Pseudomonadota bacterium]